MEADQLKPLCVSYSMALPTTPLTLRLSSNPPDSCLSCFSSVLFQNTRDKRHPGLGPLLCSLISAAAESGSATTELDINPHFITWCPL